MDYFIVAVVLYAEKFKKVWINVTLREAWCPEGGSKATLSGYRLIVSLIDFLTLT